MSEVSKRYVEDEAFREVANMLYGPGIIAKANPDGMDIAARKKRERRQAQVGLASNIVGIAAGAAGLYDASKNPALKAKKGTTIQPRRIRISGKTKALAAGAVGLQALNLGGDAVANRVLARSAKDPKKKDMIHKRLRPVSKSITEEIPSKRDLQLKGFTTAKKGAEKGIHLTKGKLKPCPPQMVKKAAEFDVRWEGEFSKVNADKQQVFGWASIVEMNGEKVVDLQGDYISIEEVEKSAYEYVHKSRKGGDMHLRDGEQPVHASDMIESFVVTPEKKAALGLPDDTPTGWWVGYQVNDPEVWAKVKSGERTGFSIHGRGMRTPASTT